MNPFISTWEDSTMQPMSLRFQTAWSGQYAMIAPSADWHTADWQPINGKGISLKPTMPKYQLLFTGDFPGFKTPGKGLVSVDAWGSFRPRGTIENMFCEAKNLIALPSAAPDLSQVKSLAFLFKGAEKFNQPLNHWDTSQVTIMCGMFFSAHSFNQPIGEWDVSRVTDMSRMFFSAHSFNQPIGEWDVSRVTNMNIMFISCVVFNQPIGGWNTSQVTDMNAMFYCAHSFNQPIGEWDVSRVTDMSMMFLNARSFNQPIGEWDVSRVTDMNAMFNGARSFNQPIGEWDVSRVTDMNAMFSGAHSFSQPIGEWDVSRVTKMGEMFGEAIAFKQRLNQWKLHPLIKIRHVIKSSNLTEDDFREVAEVDYTQIERRDWYLVKNSKWQSQLSEIDRIRYALHHGEKLSKSEFAEPDPEDPECNICLGKLFPPMVQLLKHDRVCGHKFHAECAIEAFHEKRSCPLCRSAVQELIIVTKDGITLFRFVDV
jgi:surface protein